MSIVGDAYAVPMVDELRRRPYDLSSLFILGTGGAATGEQHTEALLDILPKVVILDGYGASETGGMAFGARTKGKKSEGFAPSAGRDRDLRGPLPFPAAGRPGGRLDGADAGVSRSDTCTTGRRPRARSRSSTGNASPFPATGPSSRPTGASSSSGGTRSWSTPVARRSSSRRWRTLCVGTPTWPTRSSWAGPPTGSARRSWRWWHRRMERRSIRAASASSWRGKSPVSRRRAPSPWSAASVATPTASPTTAGPRRRPSARQGRDLREQRELAGTTGLGRIRLRARGPRSTRRAVRRPSSSRARRGS